MFKIGFDFHGVVQEYPNEFKEFFAQLKKDNVQIGIISGPTLNQIHKELAVAGIDHNEFDFIYSVVDYLVEEHNVFFSVDEKGTLWTDEITWWTSKGQICKHAEIDMLFDDSHKYGDFMPLSTNFVLFNEDMANKMFG